MSRQIPTLAEVLESVRDVEGWMSPDQAEALYDAARACPSGGTIVEIGSFRGRSTIVLASASPDDVRLFAIDPHAGNDRGPQEIAGFEEEAESDNTVFEANLTAAGVRDRVRHLRSFSHDALGEVDGSVEVLYIDGAHRYAPARQDILEWGARVADGGTLLIHDSFSSVGVTGAIARELVLGTRFRYVRRARSLAVYRADLPEGTRARIANAGHQTAQIPWFVRNIGLKVLLSLKLGSLMKKLGRPEPEWPY